MAVVGRISPAGLNPQARTLVADQQFLDLRTGKGIGDRKRALLPEAPSKHADIVSYIDFSSVLISGGTIADEGTLGRDGSLIGGTAPSLDPTGGPNGGRAIAFPNGSAIRLGDNDPIFPKDIGGFSITAWVKQDSALSQACYFTERPDVAANGGRITFLRDTSNRVRFQIRQGGSFPQVEQPFVSDADYHFFAMIYDRANTQTMSLWIDDDAGTPTAIADADLTGDGTSFKQTDIGTEPDGLPRFHGLMAYWRAFDYAISTSMVQRLYQEGLPA